MAEVELKQLGLYDITGLLHESSTSTLYSGKHRKKDVLIQRLTTPLTAIEDKIVFLAHTKQLKKVKARTIVPLIEANFDGDYGYLVFEHTTGTPLNEQLELTSDAWLTPVDVRLYLSPLANALSYAHSLHVIHGNLHPGNILIDKQREILLTGFAITPPGFTPALEDETAAVPYMAPEQLQGQFTGASDQYALAVITYEWLCGRRPYPATDRTQLLQQQQHEVIIPPRSLNSAISATVEEVLLQALALDPTRRFPHIKAFADAYLNALLGISRPITPPVRHATVPTAPVLHKTVTTQPITVPTILDELPTAALEDAPAAAADLPDTGPLPLEITRVTKKTAEKKTTAKKPSKRKKKTEQVEAEVEVTVDKEDENQGPAQSLPIIEHEEAGNNLLPLDVAARVIEQAEEANLDDAPVKDSRLVTMVAEDLRQGGVLSRRLPGYEERPAQIEMATLVSRAISKKVPAIIEAATGTGKSLAYLVPVVRSGQVAIISTANKALQEQLFYKDIPFVQKHIKHFEAALVKGVSNYICLDRVESERMGMQLYTKNTDFQHLYDFIHDPETGLDFNGDFETLGFKLSADIRGRVATDSDQCAWSKCAFFDDCYVRQMRENAEAAQIIVVNHTLLLLDAAIGGFLLPERDLIVLDEAHHLEEEATRSFTITINPAQIQTLLAQRALKTHSQLTLQDDAMRAAQVLWQRLEQGINLGFKGRANLEIPLEEGLHLATAISDLGDSMRKQRPKELPEKEGQLYDKLLKRVQNLAENIRIVFSVAERDKFVYYIERAENSSARGPVLQASAAPLDVTEWLKERLFNKCNVISTSATLATIGPNPARPEEKGPNFSYFRRRIGLDPIERTDVIENILPLTFDYENNALLYTPRHLPPPTFGQGEAEYIHDLALEMYRLVKYSHGRAFLLFSSKRVLEGAYTWMAPHLPYPLLKQGDMSRLELTRRFRAEENAVLFGLKSFWEGVDIAGDALSLVVIDKLPFDPPDDPVHEARVAHMKAAGENWFGIYVLPQAVLRLKQGIGRLLRTREDRGVMAILDTRLHTKGYGRMVLNALPPAPRTMNIRDVERFFKQQENTTNSPYS
ncbi:helicase C-terminal domain-containing protein [Dictyobacter arantiisoli]|uniref:Protein kinase domain-containing protein n=1 Tax=Dictyobacter arantiisoli TaxID=2014874 RepID=A0A5A5TAL1_9CHLR|nr:helicase C-terminal domain-containing protein [Dictyobacter arantiisoli]GCF08550.1 hypothetical protein KDI_21140 [Dictyobacter arantiisoli]